MGIERSTTGSPMVRPAAKPAVDNNLVALAVAQMNRQSGIIDLSGTHVELFDKPDTTTVTIEGRNAGDTADAQNTAYVFNTDIGTQTTGKAVAYDDGNNGALIQRHIVNTNYGRGLKIKAITFTGVNEAGNQDATVIQRANFAAMAFTTSQGRQIPSITNIAKALRNTQFQSGQVTVALDMWVNSITKLSVVVPAGCTLVALIEWSQDGEGMN